jgi:hypothetical protein
MSIFTQEITLGASLTMANRVEKTIRAKRRSAKGAKVELFSLVDHQTWLNPPKK